MDISPVCFSSTNYGLIIAALDGEQQFLLTLTKVPFLWDTNWGHEKVGSKSINSKRLMTKVSELLAWRSRFAIDGSLKGLILWRALKLSFQSSIRELLKVSHF